MAPFRTVNVSRACLSAALCAALLAVPVGAATGEPQTAASPPERILFVGNSHTARYGGLDRLVGGFVAAEQTPRPYESDSLTKGGVTLEYHWGNGAPDRIRTGGFDTVVLQGYLPGAPTPSADTFLMHGRLLDSVISEAGAETVFFMTWPRSSKDWSTIEDVVEAHRQLSLELDARVAPAALAFERARAERPDLTLIDEDGVHATWEGAYLAAATVYATLYGRSPEGLDFVNGVEPETAGFLQRVAWQTVQDWNSVVHRT